MEPIGVPQNWVSYLLGGLVAVLTWVVRGYAVDVRKIKATYMTREEIQKAIVENAEQTKALFESHQERTTQQFATLQNSVDARHVENTANFRELRMRLDTTNDTLLKLAMK